MRDGRVDFRGTYYQAPECEILPSGPRPGGPPLLIAGKGPRLLRLTAEYADAWNTAWHAEPPSAEARLGLVRDACAQHGRDPATLNLTVGVTVAFPDLDVSPPAALSGTPEQVAEALRGYAALGLSDVIVDINPYTAAALDRFAEAVDHFRASPTLKTTM